MTTLKEIAQICGVSISTVSNILNGQHKVSEKTKKRVLEVVKETGYQPNYFAQGMRKHKTKIVGIIIEDLMDFTAPIVESIMAQMDQSGYRTILINMRLYNRWGNTWYEDDQKLQSVLKPSFQELLSIKVDGIVYIAGHCRVIHCFPENLNIPGVMVYALSKNPRFPSVIIDDESGSYDMTRYLISMGHRKIGVITGVVDNLHSQNRMKGYQKALSKAHLSFDSQLIRNGDWERESGYANAKELIDQGVTAIFCMNDKMAGGVYDYCYEKDFVIGKDISIVGYDNTAISEYLRPNLTTNEIPVKHIGEQSAEIMLRLLEHGKPEEIPSLIKLPCRMVIRDSVKKISI